MKRQLLLKAAEIVERAPKENFDMGDISRCILGYCRYEEGFEELKADLYEVEDREYRGLPDEDFILVAAKFFGISKKKSESLFAYYAKHKTPEEAAAALRKVAGPPRRLPGAAGVRAVKKAIKEVLAVPSPAANANETVE